MEQPAIEVSAEIKARGMLPLVERATEWIRETLSTLTMGQLKGEWVRVENSPADELVGLRLHNEYGSALGVFRAGDLADRRAFVHQLNPVLRALTRTAIDQLTQRIREPVVAES
jgi:hypothetical protein